MSSIFRKKVATFLLLVYVPVMFTLGLQHHDGPLYPLPVTLTNSTAHTVPISAIDGFCMACHFASRHFFEHPFHFFSAVQNVAFLKDQNQYERPQVYVLYTRKRAPPSV